MKYEKREWAVLVRRLLTVGRIMVAGMRNFFRNAWLSVAATTVMLVTLTIMLSAIVFNMALGSTLDQVTQQIDIAVFFEDDSPRETIDEMERELQAMDNVVSTYFVSKAEALRRYQAEHAGSPDILEAISEEDNPLPRSLEIQLADLNRVDEIVILTQDERFLPIIEDSSLGEDRRRTIERIAGAREFLITFGISASLIFATISVLIIFNTIRMAIFARSEEIGIMRLVGATNGYIRGPFLFEAILDGLIAAALALGVVYLILYRWLGRLVDYVDFSATLAFFGDYWWAVAIGTLLAGALLGIFSSILAMIRYLRL